MQLCELTLIHLGIGSWLNDAAVLYGYLCFIFLQHLHADFHRGWSNLHSYWPCLKIPCAWINLNWLSFFPTLVVSFSISKHIMNLYSNHYKFVKACYILLHYYKYSWLFSAIQLFGSKAFNVFFHFCLFFCLCLLFMTAELE